MYCGENPISYHDADGCIADTVWDAASLISGAVSFGYNVKNGNKKEAVFDAVGMLADTAALLLPFVPGGFGTARKAIKATKVAAEVVGATENVISGTDSVIDGIQNGDALETILGATQVAAASLQLNSAVNQAGELAKSGSEVTEVLKESTVNDTAKSVKSNHGNSLNTTKPAQGYALRDNDTDQILKFEETTRGEKRYTKKYLKENNAYMDFQASGSKKEMHDWQHEKILDYKLNNEGKRPRLNKSDW